MIDKGFVKIDRDIKIDYSNNDIRVYLHLLMSANYTEKNVYDRQIKVGQCITFYGKVADALDISLGGVKTAIKHLTGAGLLVWHGVRDKYSICTISDYDKKCKEIKYNFVMLNRSVTAESWYKHEGAAKVYYYLLLNIPPGDNSITLKPIYLQQLLGLGHSQYSNGIAKLIDNGQVTCLKVGRQIQLSLANSASTVAASPPSHFSPAIRTSSIKGEQDKEASSDTQYYY